MHARFAISFWLAALAAMSASELTAQDKPASKDDPQEIVIAGEILKEDARDKLVNAPSKVHAFRFQKDKAYVIDLVGNGIVPFGHIEDSAGNSVAQGVNRVNNLSRMRFTSPKDDIYLIFASSQSGQGKYTLSIKPFVVAAVKLIPMDAPVAKKPSEIKGTLSIDDPPDQFRDLPGKVYTVDLKKGKTYVIDLISGQFDVYLLLQNAGGGLIAQDDDSGGNLNSRLRFQPPEDGRFRLVASTFSGQVGPYTLRVTEAP